MADLFTLEALSALLALTSLEIVLGIDNIVFLSILVEKLPEKQQPRARFIGLSLAMLLRIVLLLLISWIMLLTSPLFSLFEHPFSGKDLILLAGGLFLLWKATHEIHHSLEAHTDKKRAVHAPATFFAVIAQIIVIDLVFSLDSVITAVGIGQQLPIMVTAIVIAIVIMMVFAKFIGDFIHRHPTFKMLALSFLLLVGVMLVADGLGKHIDRNYLYFAMAFSLFVEILNLKVMTKKRLSA